MVDRGVIEQCGKSGWSSINRAACTANFIQGHRKTSKQASESRAIRGGAKLAGELSMATAKPLKIGLFGDGGGSPIKYISDKQPPKTLEMIEIWSSSDVAGSGAVINGIRFTYTDDKGTPRIIPSSGTWGSANGTHHKVTINTDKNEYVTKIEGSIGKAFDEDLGITSLKFITSNNGQTYGPYGDPDNGTPFSVPLENAGIVGFFAGFDTHLNALGFYALQLATGNNA